MKQTPLAQEVVDHRLELDSGYHIDLRLPKTLTQPEAARLMAFISSLVPRTGLSNSEK